jgi:dCTP deaminase
VELADLGPSTAGVLPNQLLSAAVGAGWLSAGDYRIAEENIQPASLDLRLGEVAYRIRCSFLPHDETVENKVKASSSTSSTCAVTAPSSRRTGPT